MFNDIVLETLGNNTQALQALIDISERRTYSQGEIFVRAGMAANTVFFVEEGLCRLFYYKDDKEVTTWFAFENTTLATLSFLAQTPNDEYLQALEPSTLIAVPYNDLQQLYVRYPAIERLGRMFLEQMALHLGRRLKSLQFYTAKERYQELLHAFPTLPQRIPQHFIASFLGITPETLSRIRAS
ncbi:MAG: Crp/Fnr family transcriptional regulator [Candidatus Kapaibacteriota bacterium]